MVLFLRLLLSSCVVSKKSPSNWSSLSSVPYVIRHDLDRFIINYYVLDRHIHFNIMYMQHYYSGLTFNHLL